MSESQIGFPVFFQDVYADVPGCGDVWVEDFGGEAGRWRRGREVGGQGEAEAEGALFVGGAGFFFFFEREGEERLEKSPSLPFLLSFID